MIKIKNKLKKLAKDFNLKYDAEWFKYMFISVRHEILTEYLGLCPDPIYQKYGKNREQRIANLDKFMNSKDFKKCLKRYSGQVASKEGINHEGKWIEKIKSKKVKKELLELHRKIMRKFTKNDSLALVTIPRNKKEKAWLLRYCLIHEWIHILLYKNKIKFKKINKKHWKYDEGLCTYFTEILENNVEKLEYFAKKTKYPLEKQYYIYAIKFNKLFKDKNTPKERRQVMNNLMKKLK